MCSWSATDSATAAVTIGDHGPSCFVYSRAHQCVFSPAQFSGCDPEQAATSCSDDCAAYDAARAADADAHYDVEVLYAGCESFNCHDVTRVADACYVDGRDTPYDCALGPEEIRRRAASASATPATSPPLPDAGLPPGSDPRRWLRAADEWQGMLPQAWLGAPPCTESASCGMARACVDGSCVPCLNDSECAAHEACTLGNCALQANTTCRSRHDCTGEALCILSGYTGNDPRSNSDMRAYCLSPNGGSAAQP